MRDPRGKRGRGLAVLGAVALLVLGPVAAASAATPTSTATVSGGDRAAAVQAVLDRVLGPGGAVVTVSDTVRTSTASTTSVRWGSGAPGASSVGVVTVGGTTTSRSVVQQNLVGGTSTAVVTPPGSLVRRSVSVALDRAHLAGRRVAVLRALVVPAAGLVRSRGDSLSIVVTSFAKPAASTVAPPPSIPALLGASAQPAIWVLGGLLALVVTVLALGGRTKRSSAVSPR